jgi:S1-C subfamily serine protease
MKRTWIMVTVMLLAGTLCNAHAGSAGDETLSAVVRIRYVFSANVESAAVLGKERAGNGVVIDTEGTILTLSFLTRDAEKIEVTGPDNEPVAATLVGYDFGTGFSLLRTSKPLGVTPLKLGKSSGLAVGDSTIIVGAAGAGEVQMARVVSRKEFAGSWEYLLDDAIFTTPAFADFSGAALMNSKGQLVGIGYLLTYISLQGIGLLPCNMFIPIDALNPILADLKSAGRPLDVKRPWLGINAEEAHGRVFITRVTAGGPAERAGLKVEDMIISVSGKAVSGLADFYHKIFSLGDAGVEIPLSVLTGDKIRDVKILSADRYKERRTKSPDKTTL